MDSIPDLQASLRDISYQASWGNTKKLSGKVGNPSARLCSVTPYYPVSFFALDKPDNAEVMACAS